MIARYSREIMASIWLEEAKFARWFQVELAVAQIQIRERVLPRRDGAELVRIGTQVLKTHFRGKRATQSVAEISRLEKDLKHDVLSFTTFCAEKIGPSGRYFHYGLTSTDIVDTAMAIAVQDSGKVLLATLDRVLKELKRLALKHRKLVAIGRTHGMHAEPTVFGLRFLGFYEEMQRNRARLTQALARNRTGKLSGAVGANVHFSPASERKILKLLGLEREAVSTQTLPRDRLAELFSAIAITGASMERITTEIRHLSRSEVGEAREGFSKLQKGSSAMPHKRNPVASENLTGCARVLRSYLIPALEDVALWHERDISHSSVERMILPDAFILADYSLDRLAKILAELVVNEDRVRENLRSSGGVPLSGHVLLGLVKAGASREEAYRWVQKASHRALDGKGKWIDLLFEDVKVAEYLTRTEVAALLSEKRIVSAADAIYRDVLKGAR
jgi:adenylosuccinate lyase